MMEVLKERMTACRLLSMKWHSNMCLICELGMQFFVLLGFVELKL